MESDRVDILLATYNGEKYVAAQIHSILKQSHHNFQILIRDDGSTDQTWNLLQDFAQRYPSKIKLFTSNIHVGTIQNFSTLMQHSTSGYLMCCDQDDIWMGDKVSKSLCAIKQAESYYGKSTPLLVHTDLKVVDERLELISPSFWRFSKISPTHCRAFGRLLMQNSVTGCTIIFNRPLLELALPIPPEAEMHDWWLALVACAFGKIEALKETPILYRQHGKNTVGAQKFSYRTFFKKQTKKLELIQKRKLQAKKFLNQFEKLLTAYQQEILNCYIDLEHQTPFQRRMQMIKYGFWRNGLFRNLITLLIGK
jgi:glycosyltransferase involved in cell wall biosynthesis